jgi:hypothetical protein
VQIDPIKPKLKAPRYVLLKLIYDEPRSIFAFKFNLRRYNMEPGARSATMQPGIFLGVEDIVAEWVASSAPLQSLAHVYDGKDRPTTAAKPLTYPTLG